MTFYEEFILEDMFNNVHLMVFLCLISLYTNAIASLPPIIIIPGLGGSVLEIKLNHRPPFGLCKTETPEWFTIWADPAQMLGR